MKSLVNYIIEKFNYGGNGDEFYTRLVDIEKGLKIFKFNNKIVYCNCDNPKFSNFYKYFKDNFAKLGIKKLIATYYSDDPYVYEYDGENEIKNKIKSGRFQDNVDILKKADIIVTNPPYSDNMPIELINLCFENKKDFIIVGPLHLITNKIAFNYIKNEQLFSTPISINKFDRPSGDQKNAPSCWWTNIYVDKSFKPTKEYNEHDYKKYDNYDAIDCKNYVDLPKDYDGIIGTSYRFICHLDKNYYKIIDITNKLVLDNKRLGQKLLIQKK